MVRSPTDPAAADRRRWRSRPSAFAPRRYLGSSRAGAPGRVGGASSDHLDRVEVAADDWTRCRADLINQHARVDRPEIGAELQVTVVEIGQARIAAVQAAL